MATKKIEAENTVVEPVDEWTDMRRVRLPKAHDGEDKSLYVAINGHTYMVPKGQECEVPYPVYERIMIMQEAQDNLQDYRDSIPNDA